MKINKLFLVDLLLLVLFLLTVASGFGMHAAGHGTSHEVWHGWAVFHVLSTLFFVVATIAHIYMHWNWYKGLFTSSRGKKSRVTIIVSILFIVLTITGILAFIIPEGANSPLGLAHYKVGIVCAILFAGHIIKRHKILWKGLTKRKGGK